MCWNKIAAGAVLALLASACGTSHAATDFKIVTAPEKDTYYAIGADLAKYVAPAADINLDVVATSGSAANARALRSDPGVRLAVMQADVYKAFADRAAAGNAEAASLIKPLRVILPLYATEAHYIVRADSELNYLHEIKNARINGGLVGSGAALITHTLYRLMFSAAMPEANASFLSNEEALVKLITDKSVDVVVVASGQPAPLIANMKPEAQKFIKLLKFDPNHPSSKLVQGVYSPATILASSYPNLLTSDFTSVSVGSFLVTYDFSQKEIVDHMGKFARSLCQNFATLQTEGHPKWREVDLSLPNLGPGWSYYAPTAREIRACASSAAKLPAKGNKKCSAEEKILGLCS